MFLLAAVTIIECIVPMFILTAIADCVIASVAYKALHADPTRPFTLSAQTHPVFHPPSHVSVVTVRHRETVFVTNRAYQSLPVQVGVVHFEKLIETG